ncbi:MAG: MoaD/ThiS family protein [Rhodanobacteraceae bacterium]|nr:MoaD/ThiS family protein [Rhodanobacteraceae bacterium]
MRVRVRHFAALRTAAGVDQETFEVDDGDLAALYRSLQQRHGWSFTESAVRVAVNDALVPWGHALKDGDEVVFLPPFSGG